MSIGILDSQYLSDIADAIRSKTGSSSTMAVSEFATAISNIDTGSGGEVSVISDWFDGYIEQISGVSGGSAEWTVSNGKTITFTYSMSTSPTLSIYNNTTLANSISLSSNVYSYPFYRLGTFNLSNTSTDFICIASTINGSATKRARPIILVPSDYDITANTKVDVFIIISAATSSNVTSREISFKYRLYEPASNVNSYKDYQGNALANVSSVAVSPSTVSLNEDGTQQLTATVSPNNAYYTGVNWTSSDNAYVSVNSSGLITGKAPCSNISITATSVADNTKYGSATVSVADSLSSDYLYVDYGTKQGSSTYYKFTDNGTNLTITNNFTGTESPYTGSLYIYENTTSTTPLFTINNNTTTYTEYVCSSTATTLYIGLSTGSYWTSNAYMPFSMDTTTTSIQYKFVNGVLTMRYLSVSGPIAVTGLTLSPSSATVGVGSTKTLTATITPASATNKTVLWSSSDNSIATVSDGVVTGVAEGSATITATSDDNNSIYDTSSITVSTISWNNFTSSMFSTSYGNIYTADTSSTYSNVVCNNYANPTIMVGNTNITNSVVSTSTSDAMSGNFTWYEDDLSNYSSKVIMLVINATYMASVTLPSDAIRFRIARVSVTSGYVYIQYESDGSGGGGGETGTWTNVSSFSVNNLNLIMDTDMATGISYVYSNTTGVIANAIVSNGNSGMSITNSTIVPPTESNLVWTTQTAMDVNGNKSISIRSSSNPTMPSIVPIPSTATQVRVARLVSTGVEYLFIQYKE